MTPFELDAPARPARVPIAPSDIDFALTAQLVVAWAGETGEDKRLGWWRSDLASEFGGEDLLRRLLPTTWPWAVLQATREAARRKDAELRRTNHDPDRLISLYNLGVDLDERLEERLLDHKRQNRPPLEALPGLDLTREWTLPRFASWVDGHGAADTTPTPAGRRLKGEPPAHLSQLTRRLVAALAPLPDHYPLPHFQRT